MFTYFRLNLSSDQQVSGIKHSMGFIFTQSLSSDAHFNYNRWIISPIISFPGLHVPPGEAGLKCRDLLRNSLETQADLNWFGLQLWFRLVCYGRTPGFIYPGFKRTPD